MQLKLANRELSIDRPLVMGILNVTPDSFSDGGLFAGLSDALAHAELMVHAGADIIDIGGESTRPGASAVAVEVELERVIPVIRAAAENFDVAISVDTSKAEVMREAVAAGAGMINDVRALREEGALQAAVETGAAVCLMHMQGTPETMQDAPAYDSLPGDIIDFLSERIDAAVGAGIQRDSIVVDPGFGFGKTDEHNLAILAALDRFNVLDVPLLVGLSRKRTLGHLSGKPEGDRVSAGIAAAVTAVLAGADIIRTHDVEETVDAMRVVDAVRRAGQGQ